MYINKVILVGNLTRDPEAKVLPNGTTVTSFSLATTRVWYDKDRKKQEATEYHNVVVFGKQADSVAQWLKKGSQVLIEGRLQTRSWDKDGAKQYRTEIITEAVQFGSRQKDKPEKAIDSPATSTSAGLEYPEEQLNPEDIPF